VRKIDKANSRQVKRGEEPVAWQVLIAELRGLLATCKSDPEKNEVAREFFDRLNKQNLRDQLRNDQRGLCAFCECEITRQSAVEDRRAGIRIAHWLPIHKDPEGAVRWSNLFASCPGGPYGDSCDAAQGDADLKIETPAERNHAIFMEFGSDGSLTIPDQSILRDAAERLNLMPRPEEEGQPEDGKRESPHRLTEARAAAITGTRKRLEKKFPERTASRDVLLKWWSDVNQGQTATPHPSAVMAWLKRQADRR